MYIDELFTQSKNTVVLDTQYRMEKEIGKLISDLFYSGKLKNGNNRACVNSLLWVDYSPTHKWPDINEESSEKPAIYNLDECWIIKDLLNEMEAAAENERSIAIIFPYRQQVCELRRIIPECKKLKITIDTVDGFQGRESDVVIFGITRTTGSYRFLADDRRLNVALSRARDQLIIIGNREYATKHRLLERIATACKVEYYSVHQNR